LWAALLLVPPGFVWLLAYLVDVLVVAQLALVAMLIVGCWAILGHRLAKVLAFPLFFLFFAVPMGEGLIAPMMEFTAFSTVWLIQETGIPVYREGLFFTLPTGRWSVVEACSGVRYIIASVTVGTLFAYLTYVSLWRRVLFIAISAIVPIFANTLRAYLIVMLGHMSDMTLATGADHLVYGWVFFGVVIFVLFWLGSFFREEQAEVPAVDVVARCQGGMPASQLAVVATSVVVFMVVGAIRLLAVAANVEQPAVVNLALPSAAPNWTVASRSIDYWEPPSRVSGQRGAIYRRENDTVGLFVQYSDDGVETGEVIGSSSLFTLEESEWRVVHSDKASAILRGETISVDEGHVVSGTGSYLAWSWYVQGSKQTSNDYLAKIQEAAVSLRVFEGRPYRVVVVAEAGASLQNSRQHLQGFLDGHGEALLEALSGSSKGGL